MKSRPKIQLTIDGQSIEGTPGQSILEAHRTTSALQPFLAWIGAAVRKKAGRLALSGGSTRLNHADPFLPQSWEAREAGLDGPSVDHFSSKA